MFELYNDINGAFLLPPFYKPLILIRLIISVGVTTSFEVRYLKALMECSSSAFFNEPVVFPDPIHANLIDRLSFL